MRWKPVDVLAILDQCPANFTFPMLDNGYVYLAETRLSVHRTETDWGIVIEVFGYSPRAGLPDTNICTFASTLHNRDTEEKYKSRQAYENYLAKNPHYESRFVFPIDSGEWEEQSQPSRRPNLPSAWVVVTAKNGDDYSYLSATMGSTFIARRAGM